MWNWIFCSGGWIHSVSALAQGCGFQTFKEPHAQGGGLSWSAFELVCVFGDANRTLGSRNRFFSVLGDANRTLGSRNRFFSVFGAANRTLGSRNRFFSPLVASAGDAKRKQFAHAQLRGVDSYCRRTRSGVWKSMSETHPCSGGWIQPFRRNLTGGVIIMTSRVFK